MKIMNNYTLEDLLSKINSQYPLTYTQSNPAGTWTDKSYLFTLLKTGFNRDEYDRLMKLYDLLGDKLYIWVSNPTYLAGTENKTHFTKLIELIKLRYGDHYIVATEKEIEFHIEEVTQGVNEWRLDESDSPFEKFCKKFISILISSKDKYVSILDIYNDNISKLMDGLKGSNNTTHEIHKDEDYDNDVSGLNLFNDTPQTTDVVATIQGNQYVTELSKSSAHTDNTGEANETGENHSTSESNTKYVMEKIKDIQDSYEKVLYKWSEEFDGLFIEESMVL